MELSTLVIAFFGAALAGLVMGVFGGGIGLVLVPLLLWLLKAEGVAPHLLMHVDIGTTVAVIVVAAALASYKQHKNGFVNVAVIKKMLPGLAVGVIVGALVAKSLPSHTLMIVFGAVVLLLAFQVWLTKDKSQSGEGDAKVLNTQLMIPGSALIGFLGSVIGGNPLCVPLMRHSGQDMREAVANTTVIGFVMAVIVVVMFILLGWGQAGLPRFSTGFVDWALFLPVAVACLVFTPIGVHLGKKCSKLWLQRLYGLLLLVIGVKMIIASQLVHLIFTDAGLFSGFFGG